MTGRAANGRRRGPFRAFDLVVLSLALLLVYLAVSNLDRSVRAATADGVPGTFAAARLDCVQHPGHESCICYGHYRTLDGRVREDEVYLYGASRETCEVGRAAAAVDIGAPNRVYGPEGSREWVLTAGLLLAGLGLLTRVVFVLLAGRAPNPAQPRKEAS